MTDAALLSALECEACEDPFRSVHSTHEGGSASVAVRGRGLRGVAPPAALVAGEPRGLESVATPRGVPPLDSRLGSRVGVAGASSMPSASPRRLKPRSEREKPERPSEERSDWRRPCACVCERGAEEGRWSVEGPQRPKGEAVAVTMHAPPSPLVEHSESDCSTVE
jgi:hypothetical protein